MSSSPINNVAIVGAGGQMGGAITQAILDQGKHNVTAITRPDSSSSMPTGLTAVKKANYDNHSELVEALRGQDVLIITMGVMAKPGSQNQLVDAAAAAGVKYIIPSEWDMDDGHEQMGKDVFLGPPKLELRKYIASKGCKWIGVACGFWYEMGVAGSEERFGFDIAQRTLTLFDDGNAKITVSTWPQVGRAMAKLLALPEHAEGQVSLDDWANRTLCFGSFYVSQQDILASVCRVTGTKESDWTITHEGSKERYAAAMQRVQGGDFGGYFKLLYSRMFFPDDVGEFESQKMNKELGLPEESLDEATKTAVELAKHNEGPTAGAVLKKSS